MESQVCLVPVPENTVFPSCVTTPCVKTRSPLWLVVQMHSKASIFSFWHVMCGNTCGIAIQMVIQWGPVAANF